MVLALDYIIMLIHLGFHGNLLSLISKYILALPTFSVYLVSQSIDETLATYFSIVVFTGVKFTLLAFTLCRLIRFQKAGIKVGKNNNCTASAETKEP